jgi:Dyp-type peroxidase family
MSADDLVDQADLQGNILCGYGNSYPYVLYSFIRFGDDERRSREWLREVIPGITTAEPWRSHKPPETLNVAFTHRGLKRLGLPKSVRKTFPREFRKGMKKRAELIGDAGRNGPDAWDTALRRPDAVVIATAQKDVRADREADHRAQAGKHGAESSSQRAGLLTGAPGSPYRREHFGFADGFSQPAIRGNAGPHTRVGMGTPTRDGWEEVAPGEFILGYPAEDGVPPAAPAAPLGKSGSFMVLRKLEQDVAAFRSYLTRVARTDLPFLDGDMPLALREEVIAAKMVGRWRDGRSLATSSRARVPADDPELRPDRINAFKYEQDDPHGERCPIGAHVRRANPRDSLGWEGVLTKRHRIIRRGVPYGDPLPEGHKDDKERGLIFVCFQASIERQFELIQSRWLNDGDPFWLGDETDCMTNEAGMTVPGPGEPSYLPPSDPRLDRPFITVRGGDYFFMPGLTALRALASGYWL